MEATKKHAGIENFINEYNPSGRKRIESIESEICTWCGIKINGFKDSLSEKEYRISGLCQDCQDEVFEKFEENKGEPE